MSASATPRCTPTAGCARKRADAVSRPADNYWTPSASRYGRALTGQWFTARSGETSCQPAVSQMLAFGESVSMQNVHGTSGCSACCVLICCWRVAHDALEGLMI